MKENEILFRNILKRMIAENPDELIEMCVEANELIPNWVNCKKEIPGHACGTSIRVLVITKNIRYYEAIYENNFGWRDFNHSNSKPIENVTHWMPLPKAPEVKDGI